MARRNLKPHILSGGAAALLLLSVLPASADTSFPCAPHDEIVTVLLQQFKETPQAIGKTLDGVVLELYVSQTQSWTILLTNSNGLSCIAAAGENWTPALHRPEAGL